MLFNYYNFWENKEEITVLEGHENGVTCLESRFAKLFSGSRDNTIRMWDLKTYQCICVLRGHLDSVTCMVVIENRLYPDKIY